ncbi:DNA-formamidopyrimidine glycosylase family protein [Mycobacterium sp.]|uniref:DNA-formamidopyrimidine glycosylase family protein n=1 Tax=Mycobacterium sp. TaxID=1785 RepID=UPI003A8C00F2
MPELPELQAVAEGLTAAIAGVEITGVSIDSPAVLQHAGTDPAALVGRSIRAVERRGKHLLVHADDLTMVVHLMSAGRIGLAAPTGTRAPRWVSLRLALAGGDELRLRERSTRHRARIAVMPTDRVAGHPPIARLGPDPLGLSPDRWRQQLGAPPGVLHTALRQGPRIAGIGRCYASEIMWAARLPPLMRTAALDDAMAQRLAAAADLVLQGALTRAREHITTDLPDRERRVTVVHGHFGEPCVRCGSELARIGFNDYELVYCPNCQTNGRRYADRRMSRLLR